MEQLSRQYPGTPLSNAIVGTKNILNLKEKTGLTFKTAFSIALFAETGLAKAITEGKTFWEGGEFGRELQYDPQTKRFFIHLGSKGVKPIGEGRKKFVTKTILYNRLNPEVMARGVTTWDISAEMQVMNLLKNCPGLLKAEALLSHSDPALHKPMMTIVTRLYRPGSLQSVLENRSLRLTFKERLKIACDIISGIAALHQKQLVHRDLGARNYLVEIKGKKPGQREICAVVADFGRTVPILEAYRVPVQGNCNYLSPEGFFVYRMSGSDYFRSDLFAVGCVFWHLYFGDMPAWGKTRCFKHKNMPLHKRFRHHLALINKTRAKPLKYLQHKSKRQMPLTVHDRFLQLTLQMTNPKPKLRGNAEILKKEFLKLYAEVH